MDSLFPTVLSYPLITWLLPLSWVVHDIEEITTIGRHSPDSERPTGVLEGRSHVVRRLVESYSVRRFEFTIAVAIVGMFMFGAAVAATVNVGGVGRLVFAVFLGGYFLHAFVHVGQSILARGYTPGVVTAVVVVVPSSVYLYHRLFESNLVNAQTAVWTAAVGLLLFVPIVVFAQSIARGVTDRVLFRS